MNDVAAPPLPSSCLLLLCFAHLLNCPFCILYAFCFFLFSSETAKNFVDLCDLVHKINQQLADLKTELEDEKKHYEEDLGASLGKVTTKVTPIVTPCN